ncbi:intestinal mucin-like protein, partial [Clarias magur]
HKPVCVFGINKYLPGDEVPTDSCEVCHCGTTVNTSTGFHNIQCTPMACNTTCQKGFSYEAVSGQCCGICVQKQCIYENEGHPNIISTVE